MCATVVFSKGKQSECETTSEFGIGGKFHNSVCAHSWMVLNLFYRNNCTGALPTTHHAESDAPLGAKPERYSRSSVWEGKGWGGLRCRNGLSWLVLTVHGRCP